MEAFHTFQHNLDDERELSVAEKANTHIWHQIHREVQTRGFNIRFSSDFPRSFLHSQNIEFYCVEE